MCIRDTFNSPRNAAVVKWVVKEVHLLNPQFQAGQIRSKFKYIGFKVEAPPTGNMYTIAKIIQTVR